MLSQHLKLGLRIKSIIQNSSGHGETHVETPDRHVSVLASIWAHGSDLVSSSMKRCRNIYLHCLTLVLTTLQALASILLLTLLIFASRLFGHNGSSRRRILDF